MEGSLPAEAQDENPSMEVREPRGVYHLRLT
jgi:hypothetical protein